MKSKYYLGVLLLITSLFCYGNSFLIDEKYTGASFIKNVNNDELIIGCSKDEGFWRISSNEQRKLDLTRCPLYTTEFSFNKLYDLLNKKTVIYRDGDLELVMDRKHYETTKNQSIYEGHWNKYIVYEVNLSLVYKQEIRDTITLAGYSYNPDFSFYYQTNYYYIDLTGDIYTLSLEDYSYRINLVNKMHYKIDKQNLCFNNINNI